LQLLPVILHHFSSEDVASALGDKQATLLDAMDVGAVLKKAAQVGRQQLQQHASRPAPASFIPGIRKWSPDDKPEDGVGPIFQMLLGMVTYVSVLDGQGRVRTVEWLEKVKLIRTRTCSTALEMLAHALVPGYCAAQTVLGIKFSSQLTGDSMDLLATMSLTLTDPGLRDVLARSAADHGQTTGMLWKCRQERTQVQTDPGEIQFYVTVTTHDNINVRKFLTHTGFLHVKHPPSVDSHVVDFLEDQQVKDLVAKVKNVKCACTKGCATHRCGCYKRDLPCGKDCESIKNGTCGNPLNVVLNKQLMELGVSVCKQQDSCGPVVAVPTPEPDVVINMMPLVKGSSSVLFSSGVATSVSERKVQQNRFTKKNFQKTLSLSGINPANNCLSTSTSKDAVNMIKGANDFNYYVLNEAALTLQYVKEQEAAGLVVGVTKEENDSVMHRFKRWFKSAGLHEPNVSCYAHIELVHLQALVKALGIDIREDSKSASYICKKVISIMELRENTTKAHEHVSTLCRALDVLYPGYQMSETNIPVIDLREMTVHIRQTMEALRAGNENLYCEIPEGMQRPTDRHLFEGRVVRWWRLHEHLLQQENQRQRVLGDDGDHDNNSGMQQVGANMPLQKAGLPILGSSGDAATTEKFFTNTNAYVSPNHQIIGEHAAGIDSSLHSCPCNTESSVIIPSQCNWWRHSSARADRLNGDKGRTTAAAAASAAEEVLTEKDLDTRDAHSLDDSSYPHNTEAGSQDDSQTQTRGWVLLAKESVYVKCRNVRVTQDNKFSVEIPDTNKKGSWKPVTVESQFHTVTKPTFHSACEAAARPINPTRYEYTGARGPPSIAVDIEHKPVQPLHVMEEPLDLCEDNEVHLVIVCCDLAEMLYVHKMIARGLLKNVTIMMAGLHLQFKAGFVAFTRHDTALDLTGLVKLVSNLSDKQLYIPSAFEMDQDNAGDCCIQVAVGLAAHLYASMIRDYVREGLFTQQEADDMVKAVKKSETGTLYDHLRRWIIRESARDNWVRAAANYIGDIQVFWMLYTSARTLNVDMLATGQILAMKLFHKTGACPKYAMETLLHFLLGQLRPEGYEDLVLCSSLAPWRGDGELLQRGKLFTMLQSLGGMHMDEQQETHILEVKRENPLDENGLKKHCMAFNLRHMVGSQFLDSSKLGENKKHKRGLVPDREKSGLVCVTVTQLHREGKLNSGIPDTDPSQRSDDEARELVSLGITRFKAGHPETLLKDDTKPEVIHKDIHAVKTLLALHHRHHAPQEPVEVAFKYKNKNCTALCSPYSAVQESVHSEAARRNNSMIPDHAHVDIESQDELQADTQEELSHAYDSSRESEEADVMSEDDDTHDNINTQTLLPSGTHSTVSREQAEEGHGNRDEEASINDKTMAKVGEKTKPDSSPQKPSPRKSARDRSQSKFQRPMEGEFERSAQAASSSSTQNSRARAKMPVSEPARKRASSAPSRGGEHSDSV
jgi:hypothetical protein